MDSHTNKPRMIRFVGYLRKDLNMTRKEYYLKNKERIKAKQREYYQTHKEECAKRQRERRLANIEIFLEREAKYREFAKETRRIKNRAYKKTEAGRASMARYRQSEKGRETRRRINREYMRNRDVSYKATMTTGKMTITFKRLNRLYYYFTNFKGAVTQSEPFDSLARCKQNARALFSQGA